MTELAKECKICRQIKPTTEFYKHPGGRLGVKTYCKSCARVKDGITPPGLCLDTRVMDLTRQYGELKEELKQLCLANHDLSTKLNQTLTFLSAQPILTARDPRAYITEGVEGRIDLLQRDIKALKKGVP